MNADSYYEIGSNHIVCEDYAIAGKLDDERHYAIVTDGCSASKGVDVGARILAHTAREYFKACPITDSATMGHGIIAMSKAVIKQLGLPNCVLDATLVAAICGPDYTNIYFWGDGAVVIKSENELALYSVEFTSGAPYYLSYLLDGERSKLYHEEFGDGSVVRKICRVGSNGGLDVTSIPHHVCGEDIYNELETKGDILLPCEAGTVSVFSDGIHTYSGPDDDGKIDEITTLQIVKDMADYKGFKGSFVERRMRKVKKGCEDKGITHFDDISVATVHKGE